MFTSSAFSMLLLIVFQEAFLGMLAIMAVYLAVRAAVRTVVRGLKDLNSSWDEERSQARRLGNTGDGP